MKKISHKTGFTLIELLVVIAIVGLLSAIVLASLSAARKSSRDAKRVSELKQVQNALELYAANNSGTYPASGTNTQVAEIVGLTTTYIPELPVDPTNTGAQVYRYVACHSNTTYTLMAYREKIDPVLGTRTWCWMTPGVPKSTPANTCYNWYNNANYRRCD